MGLLVRRSIEQDEREETRLRCSWATGPDQLNRRMFITAI
jgi:hypothetical protein